MAWNTHFLQAESTQTLINQIHIDSLRGFNLFSKEYLDSLNERKSLDKMSKDEFIELIELTQEKMAIDREFIPRGAPYFITSLGHQIQTQHLYEMGFNPIVNAKNLNEVFEKFLKDPEIEKLIDKMMNESIN